MHPYDCPNLLWEMKRAKRVEMTSRQLLTKNASEALQNKNNHLIDPAKYLLNTVRNPTLIDSSEYIESQMQGLDPLTAGLRGRFLMSKEAMMGKLGPDGQPRSRRPLRSIDLRKGRGVLR